MSEATANNGTTREELVRRIEEIEAMISAGRQTTARYGWMFVMWGLLYYAAIGWEFYLPHGEWAWAVCISIGIGGTVWRKARLHKRGGRGTNATCRAIDAVWRMTGIAITLFVIGSIVAHYVAHVKFGPTYTAAILLFIGLAHATSAMILRWKMQGVAAAIWWAGGLACFFANQIQGVIIFLVASFFGMVLFGLYAMAQERRRQEQAHA